MSVLKSKLMFEIYIFNIIHCFNLNKEHLTDTEKLKITSDKPGIVLDKEQTCSFLICEPHLQSSLSSEICKHDRKELHELLGSLSKDGRSGDKNAF